jgi:hypothetical protein
LIRAEYDRAPLRFHAVRPSAGGWRCDSFRG